jgi:hypothetical protein
MKFFENLAKRYYAVKFAASKSSEAELEIALDGSAGFGDTLQW